MDAGMLYEAVLAMHRASMTWSSLITVHVNGAPIVSHHRILNIHTQSILTVFSSKIDKINRTIQAASNLQLECLLHI